MNERSLLAKFKDAAWIVSAKLWTPMRNSIETNGALCQEVGDLVNMLLVCSLSEAERAACTNLFDMLIAARHEKAGMRQVVAWDCDEASRDIRHEDQADAIDAHVESLLDEQDADGQVLPSEITVYGFARLVPGDHHFGDPELLVEDALEAVDWEHGDPEDRTEPTSEMVEAARGFLAAMNRAYTPRCLEVVTSEVVDLKAWVADNMTEYAGRFEP